MRQNDNNGRDTGNADDQGVLKSLGLPPPGELLPLGYLYLLILGIASESIHFGLLGVNVLDYSNVLDVLLSPIALVTGELPVLFMVLGVPAFLWPYLKLMRWLARRKPSKKNAQLLEQPLGKVWLPMCAMGLLFAFVGFGAGHGHAQRADLQAGDLEPDTRLTFSDETSVDVHVIGVNSGYVFYALPGATEVTISPIADNLRSLRALPDADDQSLAVGSPITD